MSGVSLRSMPRPIAGSQCRDGLWTCPANRSARHPFSYEAYQPQQLLLRGPEMSWHVVGALHRGQAKFQPFDGGSARPAFVHRRDVPGSCSSRRNNSGQVNLIPHCVEFIMRRSGWTPSIVPNDNDETVYLVADDFGR